MLPSSFCLLFASALGLAAAKPTNFPRVSARAASLADAKQKLLIGGGSASSLTLAEFDGSAIKLLTNFTAKEKQVMSWVAFKEPDIAYVNSEWASGLSVFKVDTTGNKISLVENIANGTAGVVHLEFNKDKTLMVGSAFNGGNGTVDIWQLAANGTPTLKESIALKKDERTKESKIHGSVIDNSGKFFFLNDWAGDSIHVLDPSKSGEKAIVHTEQLEQGCNPRHGVFYPPKAPTATHYLVLCEALNSVFVFDLNFTASVPTLKADGIFSTISAKLPTNPAATGPFAGEIAVSADGKNVYVSNRLTTADADFTATDNIVTFSARADNVTVGTKMGPRLTLTLVDAVSSGGKAPRMFSLGADAKQAVLFNVNDKNGTGLIAFERDPSTGFLTSLNSTAIPYKTFAGDLGSADFGPQIVLPIPSTANGTRSRC